MRKDPSAIFVTLVFCVLIVFNTSGCVFAPAISGIQDAGLTESGRKQRLSRDLRDFHNALFWGNLNGALPYIQPESMSELRTVLLDKKKSGRIVDSKIEFVDFSEGAWKASVDVSTRVHDKATNIVKEVAEFETWNFTVQDGWKVESIERQRASNS